MVFTLIFAFSNQTSGFIGHTVILHRILPSSIASNSSAPALTEKLPKWHSLTPAWIFNFGGANDFI